MNGDILAREGGGGIIIVVEGRWDKGEEGWPMVSLSTGERRGEETFVCVEGMFLKWRGEEVDPVLNAVDQSNIPAAVVWSILPSDNNKINKNMYI